MELPGNDLFIDNSETEESGTGAGGSVDIIKELWAFA
jgi:hypothetical protein